MKIFSAVWLAGDETMIKKYTVHQFRWWVFAVGVKADDSR